MHMTDSDKRGMMCKLEFLTVSAIFIVGSFQSHV